MLVFISPIKKSEDLMWALPGGSGTVDFILFYFFDVNVSASRWKRSDERS